jgi:hypothetical protein
MFVVVNPQPPLVAFDVPHAIALVQREREAPTDPLPFTEVTIVSFLLVSVVLD